MKKLFLYLILLLPLAANAGTIINRPLVIGLSAAKATPLVKGVAFAFGLHFAILLGLNQGLVGHWTFKNNEVRIK